MRTKESNLAGTWYPREERRLRSLVDELLAVAPSDEVEPTAAAIVPHAAYQYSGRAAAHVYARLVSRHVGRVVLLAPSHHHGFVGAVVPDYDAFATPLGRVRVDGAAVERLREQALVRADDLPFDREHSLEIQLPFLQVVCSTAAVVPVLVGELRSGDATTLAVAVSALLEADSLLLVSSDFTHYGAQFAYLPFPPRDAATVSQHLRELDAGAIEYVLRADPRGFRRYVASTGATICGRRPISILLEQRCGGPPGRLLEYYTSLDVSGDYEHSVSYAAIVFPPA